MYARYTPARRSAEAHRTSGGAGKAAFGAVETKCQAPCDPVRLVRGGIRAYATDMRPRLHVAPRVPIVV